MITEETFRRGAKLLNISANTSVYAELCGCYSVVASTTGLKLKVADARLYQPGGIYYDVVNLGANSFELCTDDNAVIATLTTNQWATMSLVDNSTQAGIWCVHIGTAGSAALPSTAAYMYYGGHTGSGGNYRGMHEYNQSANVLTAKTIPPHDLLQCSCGTLGGAACYLGTGDGDQRRVLHYDPDVWTAGPSLLPGTSSQSSEEDSVSPIAGKLYAFGGDAFPLRTLEYDGATFVAKMNRGSGRGWTFIQCTFPSASIGSATYLMAGGNATDEGHNYVDEYVVDSYTAKTERPLPVYGLETRCKNIANGDIFVFGGHAGFSNGNNVWSNRVSKYNVSSNSHSLQTSLPLQIGELMAAEFEHTGYLAYGDTTSGSGGGHQRDFRAFDMNAITYMYKLTAVNTKQNSPQNQATAVQP